MVKNIKNKPKRSRRGGPSKALGYNKASRPIDKRNSGQTGKEILYILKRIETASNNLDKKVDKLLTQRPGDLNTPPAPDVPPHTDSRETQTDPMDWFDEALQLPLERRIRELEDANQALDEQIQDLKGQVQALDELKDANKILDEQNRNLREQVQALKDRNDDISRERMNADIKRKYLLDAWFDSGKPGHKYEPGEPVYVRVDGDDVAFGHVDFATDQHNDHIDDHIIVRIEPDLNPRITVEGGRRTVSEENVVPAPKYAAE